MDKLESEISSIFEKAAKGGYETLLGGCIKWNQIHSDVEKVITRHLTSRRSRAAGACGCPEPVIYNWKGVKRCSRCQLAPPA